MKKYTWIAVFATFFVFSSRAQAQKCLTMDFCDFNCGNTNAFYKNLDSLSLKKGEFFTLIINHINPYRYNIKVTVQNDTFGAGQEPALFTQFMDISTLGDIAGALINLKEPSISQGPKEFKDKQKGEGETRPIIGDLEEKLKIASLKAKIIQMADSIEINYLQINDCYTSSSVRIYQAQTDCFHLLNKKCFEEKLCTCADADQKKAIKSIADIKRRLIVNINELVRIKGIDSAGAASLKKELQEKKYSTGYLNSIYLKTYSNFLIAENTELLSTYTSFPIQVQGDLLELKIDITPKGSGAKEEKKEDKDKEGTTNTLTSQSPVTVNINPDKPAIAAKPGDKPDPKADSGKKEDSTEELHSADELKVTMPAAAREYHLSYKYRTGKMFYGFSSGFFMDGLKDDLYSNKPTDPNNPATEYTLVKEKQELPGKFGVMASVNAGRYVRKSLFLQVFGGPGLSVETKLQPRLLMGVGFGSGEKNKFSFNTGAAIGQVKRLSGIVDPNISYAVPQTDIYYMANTVSWFVSVNYVFDFRKEAK
jgi:hypothetical protein